MPLLFWLPMIIMSGLWSLGADKHQAPRNGLMEEARVRANVNSGVPRQ